MKSTTRCKKCRNTLWNVTSTVDGDVARCTNCHYERPYNRRKASAELTPSQKNAIERIKAFFEKRQMQTGDLAKFEVEPVIDGVVSVVAITQGNHITQSGASFFVRSRGAIELCQVYDLVASDRKHQTADHFCLMLGAKKSKNF